MCCVVGWRQSHSSTVVGHRHSGWVVSVFLYGGLVIRLVLLVLLLLLVVEEEPIGAGSA